MSECNSVECSSIKSAECSSIEETYNQKHKEEILNRAKKNIMKIIKKDSEIKQEINTEIYLKKKKIKRVNMEETDTVICLKKRNKN